VALLSDRANCASRSAALPELDARDHLHSTIIIIIIIIISSSMLQLHHSCALRKRGAHVRAVIVAALRELMTEA
jgi:hypothetical protein